MPMGSRWKNTILYVSTFFAVVALFLAVGAMFWLASVQDDRKADRVFGDSKICDVSNDLRHQIQDAHGANLVMINGILGQLFANASSERAQAFRAQLQPNIDQYAEAIGKIKTLNCNAIVPGYHSTNTTTTTEAKK